MMVAMQQPQPGGSLYGIDGRVHWPTLLARAGVRSLILWPIVAFVGGVGGVRGVLTAVAGGMTYTGVELAWDTTSLFAQQAQQVQQNGFFNGLGDGLSNQPSAQRVIDTFSPPEA